MLPHAHGDRPIPPRPPLAAGNSGSSFVPRVARSYPQSRRKRHSRPPVNGQAFENPSEASTRAMTLGSLDIHAEGEDMARRSTRTWTTSGEDVELQAESDVVDNRGIFVDEYNRLSKKYGIRSIVPGDFPTTKSDSRTSQPKGTWLSRALRTKANTSSATVDNFTAPADQRMQRHRSVGDFVVELVAPTKKCDGHGSEDIPALMRLCGTSMLYLPSGFATRPLALPTCLRATAQALVQQAGTRGLFRIPGSVRIVAALYNYYHDNPDIEQLSSTTRCPSLPSHINFGVHDVASVFKKFLGNLPGGILGSLGVFDALVGIFSQLHADPELTKTKETRLRARLIALALNTVTSPHQRDLICAVFGLLSFIGRQAETTLHEDEKGRPLPTADLMGYTALGIIFGPLLVGELLLDYSMRVADPIAGLVLLAVTPARNKKRDRKEKRSKSVGAGSRIPPTVDKFHVANGIVEMLVTHWREVVRQWRCLEVQKTAVIEAQIGGILRQPDKSLSGTKLVGKRSSLQQHDLRRGSNAISGQSDTFANDQPLSNWNQSLPDFKSQFTDDPVGADVAYQEGNESSPPRRVSKLRLSSRGLLAPNPSTWASGRILSPPLEASTGVSPSSTTVDIPFSSHTVNDDVTYPEPSIYIQRPSLSESSSPTPRRTASSSHNYVPTLEDVRDIQSGIDTFNNDNRAQTTLDHGTTKATDRTAPRETRLSNCVELPTEWSDVQRFGRELSATIADLDYSSGVLDLTDELGPAAGSECSRSKHQRLINSSPKFQGAISGEFLTEENGSSPGNIIWSFGASRKTQEIEQPPMPSTTVDSVDVSPGANASGSTSTPRGMKASTDRPYSHSIGGSRTSVVSQSQTFDQNNIKGRRLGSEAESRPDTPPWKRLLLHKRDEQRRKPTSISPERRSMFENKSTAMHPEGGSTSRKSRASIYPSLSDDSMRTTSTWQPMVASLTGGVRAMAALFDQRSKTPKHTPSKQGFEEMSPMAEDSSVHEPSVETRKDFNVKLGSPLELNTSYLLPGQDDSPTQRSFNVIQLSTPRRNHQEVSLSRLAADRADPVAPNSFPRVKLKPTGIRLDAPRSVPRDLTGQLRPPRSRFLSRTPSLGRMRSLEDNEPPVAQHLNFARPSSRLGNRSPSGEEGGGSIRTPVESPRMTSSSSLLHDRIRSLQNQLSAREEEIMQMRRLLDTREDIDIGTLSQELRQTKRECKVWRERAETAEKRVAAFERVTAKIRQRHGGNVTSASMGAASLEQSDGAVSTVKEIVRPHGRRVLSSSDRSDHTEDLEVFKERIRLKMMGCAAVKFNTVNRADGEIFE